MDMLSVAPLTGSGGDLAAYFEKESGQKEYWAKEAQDATAWFGQGADRLGLTGAVSQEQFEKVMDGELPGGTKMPAGPSGKRRMGYDLTFSAPKSVSIQALVAGDDRILEAHAAATRRAMEIMEARTAQTRVKKDGEITTVKTGNFTAAMFQHQTSREMDPQLHTHAVVANATYDGKKWRALSSEELFRMKMLGGAIYRGELAQEMQRLGYGVHQTTVDGQFELDGYSREQVEVFSERRKQIEASLAESGQQGARASELAASRTRVAKKAHSSEELADNRQEWLQRAKACGADLSIPEAASTIPEASERLRAADKAVRFALEHATERESMVAARRVEAAAMQRAVGVAGIDDVNAALRRAIDKGEILLVEKDDGKFLTTKKAVKRELQLIRSLEAGRGVMPSIQSDSAALRAATDGLNAGQAEAARLALTTTDRIVGVQGYAGAGKTFMLERVAKEATEQGFEIRAIAPTASAAQTLGEEIGADGITLSAHLQRRRDDELKAEQMVGKINKPQLWIVDEAGLASTGQMRDLVLKAERENARLVLVGDTQQMQAVAAGGPFALMQSKGMATASLKQVMRHKDSQLAEVVSAIRDGDGESAINAMQRGTHGGARLSWVELGEVPEGTAPEEAAEMLREARLSKAVSEYFEAMGTGDSALLVAELRVDRADLNQMVRDRLRENGKIDFAGIPIETLTAKDCTKAELKLAQSYERGDVVEFGRAYKLLDVKKGEALEVASVDTKRNRVILQRKDESTVEWDPARLSRVQAFTTEASELANGDTIAWTKNDHGNDRRNGELATVTAVDREAKTVTVKLASGEDQKLDAGKRQHLDHAHAVTIYRSQGRTTDHVIIAGDVSGREAAYVAASRARHSAVFMAEDRASLPKAEASSAIRGGPREIDVSNAKPTTGMLNLLKSISKEDGIDIAEINRDSFGEVRDFLNAHARRKLSDPTDSITVDDKGKNQDEAASSNTSRLEASIKRQRQKENALTELGPRASQVDAKARQKGEEDREKAARRIEARVERREAIASRVEKSSGQGAAHRVEKVPGPSIATRKVKAAGNKMRPKTGRISAIAKRQLSKTLASAGPGMRVVRAAMKAVKKVEKEKGVSM